MDYYSPCIDKQHPRLFRAYLAAPLRALQEYTTNADDEILDTSAVQTNNVHLKI